MKRIISGFGILFLAGLTVILFAAHSSPGPDRNLPRHLWTSTGGDVGIAAESSPWYYIIVPEAIWAPATGGGDWVTEIQITDMTGGSIVRAFLFYTTGANRNVDLWTSPGVNNSVKYGNILSAMQAIDTSFSYYPRVGALWIETQDTNHKILVSAKTVNGNYGKTLPGLQWTDPNTAMVGRAMVIQNLTKNTTYRSAVGFFNATSGGFDMTVEFTLRDASNSVIGSVFTKYFNNWEFMAFDPFAEAGAGIGPYDNVWLFINPLTSGGITPSQGLLCFGATANNNSNDPSSHTAVQFQ